MINPERPTYYRLWTCIRALFEKHCLLGRRILDTFCWLELALFTETLRKDSVKILVEEEED